MDGPLKFAGPGHGQHWNLSSHGSLSRRLQIAAASPTCRGSEMRLTRFMVTSLIDRRKTWIIAAGDMASAWRRFVAEGHGGDAPDPGAYDIRYHSFTIV